MSNRSFRRAHARRVEREGRRASVLARRGRMLAGTTLTATALMTASAQAANYVVTTNGDDPNGTTCSPSPGTCVTLRDAINTANNDKSADTITFDPSVTGTITLTNGPLYLNNAYGIDIEGPGAKTLTVSGGNTSQVFTVSDKTPAAPGAQDQINNLTIADGHASGNVPGGAIDDVHSTGSNASLLLPLSLTGDVVRHSSTSKYGGGIATSAPTTLNHTTVTGNVAARGGGIAAFPFEEANGKYGNAVTLENGSVVSFNRSTNTGGNSGFAPEAGGGGILSIGDVLDVRNSTIKQNRSASTGGGIAMASKYGATITHSTVSGNTARGGGGLEFYGFTISPNSNYHVRQDKYSPAVVSASTIKGNHAQDGAGIHVYQLNPGSPLTIQGTTISGNHGGPGSYGGGIGVTGNLRAPFQLVDSTVAYNGAGSGGGVSLGDPFNQPLTSVNKATGKKGSVTLANSTIADNSASGQGGGIYLGAYTPKGGSPQSGTAKLISTIVAGNYAAKQPNDLARANTSTTGGFNANFSLIKTPGTAPVTHQEPMIIGKSPELGPLANNGGPTLTMLPSGKSPVIDQGHNTLGLSVDQRGLSRKVDTSVPNPTGGDGTDIGAVELQPGQVK